MSVRLATLAESPEFNKLLDVISNPRTLTALIGLLNQVELVEFMVSALNGFLARGDVIADNVAASVGELRNFTPPASLNLPQLLQALPQLLAALPKLIEVLPNLVAVLPQLIDVGTRLQPVLASPEFEALLNSGVLDPKTVSFVGQTGTTLVESLDANQRHPQQMGAWGLLQALRDPDLQRALGFFVNFGKRFGQNINQR